MSIRVVHALKMSICVGVAMAGVRPLPNELEMKALFESFDINKARACTVK